MEKKKIRIERISLDGASENLSALLKLQSIFPRGTKENKINPDTFKTHFDFPLFFTAEWKEHLSRNMTQCTRFYKEIYCSGGYVTPFGIAQMIIDLQGGTVDDKKRFKASSLGFEGSKVCFKSGNKKILLTTSLFGRKLQRAFPGIKEKFEAGMDLKEVEEVCKKNELSGEKVSKAMEEAKVEAEMIYSQLQDIFNLDIIDPRDKQKMACERKLYRKYPILRKIGYTQLADVYEMIDKLFCLGEGYEQEEPKMKQKKGSTAASTRAQSKYIDVANSKKTLTFFVARQYVNDIIEFLDKMKEECVKKFGKGNREGGAGRQWGYFTTECDKTLRLFMKDLLDWYDYCEGMKQPMNMEGQELPVCMYNFSSALCEYLHSIFRTGESMEQGGNSIAIYRWFDNCWSNCLNDAKGAGVVVCENSQNSDTYGGANDMCSESKLGTATAVPIFFNVDI